MAKSSLFYARRCEKVAKEVRRVLYMLASQDVLQVHHVDREALEKADIALKNIAQEFIFGPPALPPRHDVTRDYSTEDDAMDIPF